jgi:cytochrome c
VVTESNHTHNKVSIGAAMKTHRTHHRPRVVLALGACAALALPSAALAADDAAAEATARQNNCFKCHALSKKKDGPSFNEIALKYKDKPGAEARLITHLTTGEKAKFPDGHEEEHKIIKVKDQAELKNLIAWLLSR